MTPRLLTEEAARAYLGGIDPRRVCAPLHTGDGLLWDKERIDEALDEQSPLLRGRRRHEPVFDFDIIERCEMLAAKRLEARKPTTIIRTNAAGTAPKILHKRMRAAVNATLRGAAKNSGWMEICGYTVAELMAHLEARFTDGMSWENVGQWHIDHIRPLASFEIAGPDCPQFKAAWALDNLQPLWAGDNIRKGALWNGKRVRR